MLSNRIVETFDMFKQLCSDVISRTEVALASFGHTLERHAMNLLIRHGPICAIRYRARSGLLAARTIETPYLGVFQVRDRPLIGLSHHKDQCHKLRHHVVTYY